jgi:hypothetical protein
VGQGRAEALSEVALARAIFRAKVFECQEEEEEYGGDRVLEAVLVDAQLRQIQQPCTYETGMIHVRQSRYTNRTVRIHIRQSKYTYKTVRIKQAVPIDVLEAVLIDAQLN